MSISVGFCALLACVAWAAEEPPPASGPTASRPASSAPATWPVSERGLLVRSADAWNAGKTFLSRRTLDGDLIARDYMATRGLATLDSPRGCFRLEGGAIQDEDKVIGPVIREACGKSGELTVEVFLSPADSAADRAVITALTAEEGSACFLLSQEKDRLTFALKTTGVATEPILVGPLSGPTHVVVSYRPGKLACYLNGKRSTTSDFVAGELTVWPEEPALVLGNSLDMARPWRGRMESFAVYARALDAAEAAANAEAVQARREARPAIPGVRALVKLTGKLMAASLNDATYRNAFAFDEYEVVKVLEGKLDHKEIAVARWHWLDRRYSTTVHRKQGDTYELTLEPYEAHPEVFEADYLATEIPAVVYDNIGQAYFDIGPLECLPQTP